MGNEILYCTACGVRILAAQISAGQGVTGVGKNYCAAHTPKGVRRATTSVRLPAQPAPEARARARRTAPGRGPNYILIGGAGAAIAVAVAVVLAVRPSEATVPPPPPEKPAKIASAAPPPSPAPTPPAKAAEPVADPHADARRALEAARRFAEANASDPEAIVRYCREHYGEVERTPFETEFKAILDGAQQKLDLQRASKQIDEALAAAEKIRVEDADFERRDEFERKLEEASRLAERFVKTRLPDIDATRGRWRAAWGAAAEKLVRGLVADAGRLADERRWDDALRRLDELPERFASAPAASELERAREDIRKRRAAADAEAVAKLKRYTGSYVGQEYPVTVDIELVGTELRAKLSAPMQGTFPMTHVSGTKFRIGPGNPAVDAEFVMSGEKVEKVLVEMGGQSLTLVPK